MSTWIDSYLQENAGLTSRPRQAAGPHATVFDLGGRVQRAVVTAAPQYFRGGQGWQAYDLALQVDAAGRWGAPGAAARIGVDGALRLASGYSQRTLSVGWLHGERYTRIASLGRAGKPQGPRLWREAGGFRHALILSEAGVKEELYIQALPSPAGEGFLVYETLSEGPPDGLRFEPGSAVDAAGRRFPLQTFVQGEVSYTGLSVAELQQASFPLVYDPTVVLGGHSADGTVTGLNGSYPVARSTANTHDGGSTELYVGQAYESAIQRYYVYRAVLKFPLDGLSPFAELLAATLGLACIANHSTVSEFNVQVVKNNWAAQDPLSGANRQAAYAAGLSSPQDVIWAGTASGLTPGSLQASPPLDLSWITPGGTAYYGLRSGRDQNGNAPPSNGNEYISVASASHASLALRPVLTVDYFAVSPAAGRLRAPLPHVGIYDTRIKLRARKRKTLLATQKARG